MHHNKISQLSNLFHHSFIPVLLNGIPGDICIHCHHPYFNIVAHLAGCFAHLFNKNAAVLSVQIARNNLWLAILVEFCINFIAAFPVTKTLVSNLPVTGTAIVIPNPVGRIFCGCHHRVGPCSVSGVTIIYGNNSG